MYNLLIGGAAGQGVETTVSILQKLLKKSGYYVFTVRDFMSRVRGGHNFTLVRFGIEPILSHSEKLDGIIAMNEETVDYHIDQLKESGFILCDAKYSTQDTRAIKVDLSTVGKELGNPRVLGSITVGAILKLFGENLNYVDEVLKEFIKDKFYEVNKEAVHKGYQLVESRFSHLQGEARDYMLLSGNEALALGAIASGIRFYCAYPMSPSTSILEYLAFKGTETGIVVEQAEDEIAAINMAIGASFAGAPAMTGTSGGGFSLMVEALGLSGMAEIPLVAVDVMRPGPATGLPTRTEQSDLKFVISASQGEFPRMVIALRNHEDAFYQTTRAVYLADKYQIPVIILSDQYLGDASSTVKPYNLDYMQKLELLKEPEQKDGNYLRYRLTEDGISPRYIPGKSQNIVTADSDEHDEYGHITESGEMRTLMMDKRMKKLDQLKLELQEPDYLGPDDFDTLIIGWGSTYGPIAEAIMLLNDSEDSKYAALIFGDIYPLPDQQLKEKAAKAKRIINVEQNATGQLAALIREYTGITCTKSILKYNGRQISGEEIVHRIRKEGSYEQ
ncbi:2-oxoacid:acceptor oxidoreductase subunit alpha [Mobilitalea sibirica]|uniref:2-oxoacid:acceptor oxidoreductase subunit alpha n=1 Tax=Mobilitalea sibirica TaxID=1462919 RepID=A0A8J7KT99_9FIRM|nr:2-oxoacid:acceptor oxidoreductase subunit alpha [Mobilitalea sibirica]MBH1941151.1 2-oxoacid:acceptor oxidoreductase subunit alpha [Mobilitalea sibirica]